MSFHFNLQMPLTISCRSSSHELPQLLSGTVFICPSLLKDGFAEDWILIWCYFCLSTLKIPAHSLLALRVSEGSAHILTEDHHFYVMVCLPLLPRLALLSFESVIIIHFVVAFHLPF